MDKNEAKLKIDELTNYLKQCSLDYYDGISTISDEKFDSLISKLSLLERSYPEFSRNDSPTVNVGFGSKGNHRRIHRFPNLSLSKAKIDGEADWFKSSIGNSNLIVEPKVDGASMTLYYSDGVLTRAVTRGDGIIGDDVTNFAVNRCNFVPKKIPILGMVAIRGEVCISKTRFDAIISSGFDVKNSRNLAVGMMKRIDKSEIDIKLCGNSCDFISHHIELLQDSLYNEFNSETDVISILSNLCRNIEFVPYHDILVDNINSAYLSNVRDIFAKEFDYQTDGLVIKSDVFSDRRNLGNSSTSPKWAIAWKFFSTIVSTKLIDVKWQVGRSGKLTPVAILEPVELLGTTVARASLHNIDIIRNLSISINDEVLISKRGEIIPQVEGVCKHSELPIRIELPDKCPSCGELIYNGICYNEYNCTEKNIARISYFSGRGCMDIESMSSETIRSIQDISGGIFSIPDIYKFDYESLIGKPGFGITRVNKIINEVKKSKTLPFYRVLVSVGIPMIGDTLARKLYNVGIRNPQDFTIKKDSVVRNTLGEAAFASLYEWLNRNSILEELWLLGVGMTEEIKVISEQISEQLSGKVFALTGDFKNYKPRRKLLELIISHGGTGDEGISKNTTHLVVGGNRISSKVKRAMESGIVILTESDIEKMIGV